MMLRVFKSFLSLLTLSNNDNDNVNVLMFSRYNIYYGLSLTLDVMLLALNKSS